MAALISCDMAQVIEFYFSENIIVSHPWFNAELQWEIRSF